MKLSNVIRTLILALSCIFGAYSLNYNNLETLGINCPSMISCRNINSNFSLRNCECDRACAAFDDCSVDATARASSRHTGNSPLSCMPFGEEPNLGAHVIRLCPRRFSGPDEVRRMCLNRNNISDPLMAAPVTTTNTNLTYWNRYCAECNNVPVSNTVQWLIKMDCSSVASLNVDDSFIWNNIEYRGNLNKWGVEVNQRFHTCELSFDMPGHLRTRVRLCRANLISTCPRDWARAMVKEDCESYTAVMYANGGAVYRNPHCALCNGLTVDSISCDRGIMSRKKITLSGVFNVFGEGDGVGSTRSSCPANQRYDPYAKKCRNLACVLPGYAIINGKCQRRK